MDTTIQAALAGLAGGLISWLFSRHDTRTDRAFTMHTEFNNSEFSRARKDCAVLLETHYGKNLRDLGNMKGVDVHIVWLVVRFYQRLWVAIHYKKINAKLVPDLFGEIFYWWYHVHFKDQLCVLDYQSAHHISALKSWFDLNAPADLKEKWDTWAKAEQAELKKKTNEQATNA